MSPEPREDRLYDTAAALLVHVRRLDRHFRKRFSDSDMEHQAVELARKLHRFDPRTVQLAVDRVIDDEPHYPTPSKLAMAAAAISESLGSHRDRPRHVPGVCTQCRTAVSPRYWFRLPVRRHEHAKAATANPPGLVEATRDFCDCQWRLALRYRSEAELEHMGGLRDPDIEQELRRRAHVYAPRGG